MAEFRKVLHIHIDRDITDHIQAKQNDTNSRFLDCQLFQTNGMPYDLRKHKIRFSAYKPDGTEVFNNGKLTRASEGMFAVELNTQTLSSVGIVVADIKIITEDEKTILTTKTFEIEVMKEIWSKESVESSNEYGAVVQLFQDVWEVRQSIFGIEKSIGTPTDESISGESPISKTIFGGLNKLKKYLFDISDTTLKTINDVKNDVNENTNDKIDKLSERINLIAPIYTTVVQRETEAVASANSTAGREVELTVHTGSGVLNTINVTGGATMGTVTIRSVVIFTESLEINSNNMPIDIYFKEFLKLRVTYRTNDNTFGPRITYEVMLTIPS